MNAPQPALNVPLYQKAFGVATATLDETIGSRLAHTFNAKDERPGSLHTDIWISDHSIEDIQLSHRSCSVLGPLSLHSVPNSLGYSMWRNSAS